MSYIHTKCSGIIDTKSRQCTKCHKKWGWFSFYFNPGEIRPVPEKMQKRIDKAAKEHAELMKQIKQGGSR